LILVEARLECVVAELFWIGEKNLDGQQSRALVSYCMLSS